MKNTGFPTPVAAQLGGVSAKTLENWRSRDFLHPSIFCQRPKPSIYSFRDIIAVRVAATLLEQGISMARMKRVVEYLRKRKGLELTTTDLLAGTMLVTDGKDVFEVTTSMAISTLLRPGQRMLFMVPLSDLVAELQLNALKHHAA
jgi:DNA-binding transcriptional MerR regulator